MTQGVEASFHSLPPRFRCIKEELEKLIPRFVVSKLCRLRETENNGGYSAWTLDELVRLEYALVVS